MNWNELNCITVLIAYLMLLFNNSVVCLFVCDTVTNDFQPWILYTVMLSCKLFLRLEVAYIFKIRACFFSPSEKRHACWRSLWARDERCDLRAKCFFLLLLFFFYVWRLNGFIINVSHSIPKLLGALCWPINRNQTRSFSFLGRRKLSKEFWSTSNICLSNWDQLSCSKLHWPGRDLKKNSWHWTTNVSCLA